MKNIYQKFKHWYRGKYIPYQSMEEMMDLSRPRYREKQEPLPDNFDPPLLARIINPIWHFWLRHWQWIIFTLITLGVLVVMILEYSSN